MTECIREDIENFWPLVDRFCPIKEDSRALTHNQQCWVVDRLNFSISNVGQLAPNCLADPRPIRLISSLSSREVGDDSVYIVSWWYIRRHRRLTVIQHIHPKLIYHHKPRSPQYALPCFRGTINDFWETLAAVADPCSRVAASKTCPKSSVLGVKVAALEACIQRPPP